jgi:hypothetical protein
LSVVFSGYSGFLCHNIAEILLKVALNTMSLTLDFIYFNFDLDVLAYGFVDFEERRDAEVII